MELLLKESSTTVHANAENIASVTEVVEFTSSTMAESHSTEVQGAVEAGIQCNMSVKTLEDAEVQTEESSFSKNGKQVSRNNVADHLVDHNYTVPPLPLVNQQSAPCLDKTEKPMQLHPKITDHEDLSENELDDLTPDSNDETFYFNTLSESDNESASGSESSASVTDPVQTRKFIVFEEELDKLFQFCSECGLPVIEKKKCLKGCMVTVKTVCLEGHTCIWNSQSYANGIPLGNLLLPAAILFSGNTYANLHQFSNILNLQFVSEPHFYRIQNQYLFQVVNNFWHEHQQGLFMELQSQTAINICGDGRCDSPGHSAKYGTYSLMEESSGKVIDFSHVQVSEVTSSNAMEYEGCKRSLDKLLNAEIPVRCLTTDRHVTITAKMKSEYPHIKHQYDVWHLSKSITKKLTKLAKRKCNEELTPWIQSISNHLWWSASTCNGDPKLLKEK